MLFCLTLALIFHLSRFPCSLQSSEPSQRQLIAGEELATLLAEKGIGHEQESESWTKEEGARTMLEERHLVGMCPGALLACVERRLLLPMMSVIDRIAG